MTSAERSTLAEARETIRAIEARDYAAAAHKDVSGQFELKARENWWAWTFKLGWEEAHSLALEFPLRCETLEKEGQAFDLRLSLPNRGRQVAARLRAKMAAAVA